MTTQTITEDRSDTRTALAHHISGDEYIVRYCSLWEDGNDNCIGTRIYESYGPISRKLDLGIEGPLEKSAALFDLIDDIGLNTEMTTEDAEWLQAEEDAGRLSYPIGVR